MRPLKSLISIEQAMQIIHDNLVSPTETEEVPLLELIGRAAAEDITSDRNVPPFRRAAMDGYAVHAAATFNATESNVSTLTCIEQIHAGEVPQKTISETECIEIATGAMVPDSSDCVVPVEYTNVHGTAIEIFRGFAPGVNVSLEGVDIKHREIVVRKGEFFTPARIGVLAALNRRTALVYKKPQVAIIPTGREIAALGTDLKQGQVYDINTYTLTSLIAQYGGDPWVFDIIADDFDALEQAILKAQSADLIVIGGGSSVGERDINIDVIRKHGEVLFHGIQIKPGKPTLCGLINGKMVINLPGYPTSCLTNGYLILLPILRKLAHLPQLITQKITGHLSKKVVSRLGRHQILTVRVEGDRVIPAFKESGAITSMAWADGYIEIPFNVDLLDEGDLVEVTLF